MPARPSRSKWEALPTEVEMFELLREFGSRRLRYWHDMGHGQIRENMGFINQVRWLEKLQPHLAGMHVHDVARPACDHAPSIPAARPPARAAGLSLAH